MIEQICKSWVYKRQTCRFAASHVTYSQPLIAGATSLNVTQNIPTASHDDKTSPRPPVYAGTRVICLICETIQTPSRNRSFTPPSRPDIASHALLQVCPTEGRDAVSRSRHRQTGSAPHASFANEDSLRSASSRRSSTTRSRWSSRTTSSSAAPSRVWTSTSTSSSMTFPSSRSSSTPIS